MDPTFEADAPKFFNFDNMSGEDSIGDVWFDLKNDEFKKQDQEVEVFAEENKENLDSTQETVTESSKEEVLAGEGSSIENGSFYQTPRATRDVEVNQHLPQERGRALERGGRAPMRVPTERSHAAAVDGKGANERPKRLRLAPAPLRSISLDRAAPSPLTTTSNNFLTHLRKYVPLPTEPYKRPTETKPFHFQEIRRSNSVHRIPVAGSGSDQELGRSGGSREASVERRRFASREPSVDGSRRQGPSKPSLAVGNQTTKAVGVTPSKETDGLPRREQRRSVTKPVPFSFVSDQRLLRRRANSLQKPLQLQKPAPQPKPRATPDVGVDKYPPPKRTIQSKPFSFHERDMERKHLHELKLKEQKDESSKNKPAPFRAHGILRSHSDRLPPKVTIPPTKPVAFHFRTDEVLQEHQKKAADQKASEGAAAKGVGPVQPVKKAFSVKEQGKGGSGEAAGKERAVDGDGERAQRALPPKSLTSTRQATTRVNASFKPLAPMKNWKPSTDIKK